MRRFLAGESVEELAMTAIIWSSVQQDAICLHDRRLYVESAIRREMLKGERSKRR